MEMFCTGEEQARARRRVRRGTCALWALAGLTAAGFLALCLCVRTENAEALHPWMIAVPVAGGWGVIALLFLDVIPARARSRHLDRLRDGEEEIREGILRTVTGVFRIPKSIRICRVELEGNDERPVRLSVDGKWISRLPADGTRVRAATVHSFITGIETIGEAPGGAPAKRKKDWRAAAGKAAAVLPLLVIWGFLGLLIGGFVFHRITDTDAGHRILICMDGETAGESELEAWMERYLEEPVQKVKIRPFSYFLFNTAELEAADLFIVPASRTEGYGSWFAPLPEELRDRPGILQNDEGVPVGLPVYEPEGGAAVEEGTFRYGADLETEETYYLLFGAKSAHLADSGDRSAVEAALLLIGE